MKTALINIVEQIAQRTTAPIQAEWDATTGQLAFVVDGFSKAGSVTLSYLDDETVAVSQRYGRVDEITDFEGIVSIAWGWYLDYKGREPFNNPSPYWVSSFIEMGYLEEEVVTTKTYRIK